MDYLIVAKKNRETLGVEGKESSLEKIVWGQDYLTSIQR